jgi:5-methyltetrahydropteroyltriglutamate--homocysteine methyltransferase
MAAESDLPLLPTMGVGSYAAPGWFIAARKLIRDGAFGEGDIAELFDDATRITIADQIEAGVDIITDGELRRQRFVYEMYDRITGLTRVAPRRRIGIPGYDMAPAFIANDVPTAPNGLGVVGDFVALKQMLPHRALKIALPGPLTFAASIQPGTVDQTTIFETLTAMLRTEVAALVDAGADYIQIDEPSIPHPPGGLTPEDGARIVNQVLAGIEARRAVHVCFGNNSGRPRADRRFGRLMDAMRSLDCEQLVLEFANREMADVECLGALSESHDIAAGVIDVKNWRPESADDIARRLRLCLDHVAPEKLTVTADCGFSALPRYMARAKMTAMVDGARLVRNSL